MPFAVFGGTQEYTVWDCNPQNFLDSYNDISMVDSPLEIDLVMTKIQENEFRMVAEITEVAPLTSENNIVFFLLTIWLPYDIDNPWYFPVIDKSDDFDYIPSFKSNYEFLSETFIYEDWNENDLHGIVIVQNLDNKEIIQASQVTLSINNSDVAEIPHKSNLKQNYPNPFSLSSQNRNSCTSVDFIVEKSGNINLAIYNMKGQKLITLVNEYMEKGEYSKDWNGYDDENEKAVSGIYLYRLESESKSEVRKMILIQ